MCSKDRSEAHPRSATDDPAEASFSTGFSTEPLEKSPRMVDNVVVRPERLLGPGRQVDSLPTPVGTYRVRNILRQLIQDLVGVGAEGATGVADLAGGVRQPGHRCRHGHTVDLNH